jgi:hypothetical protein
MRNGRLSLLTRYRRHEMRVLQIIAASVLPRAVKHF